MLTLCNNHAAKIKLITGANRKKHNLSDSEATTSFAKTSKYYEGSSVCLLFLTLK